MLYPSHGTAQRGKQTTWQLRLKRGSLHNRHADGLDLRRQRGDARGDEGEAGGGDDDDAVGGESETEGGWG